MSSITFSVIMPLYNAESYIGDAISSVLRQVYTSWELLVVDDFSTDNSVSILMQFVECDPRIRFLTNQFDKGAVGARNTGLLNSRGDYISFLDSDDLWYPDHLSRQLDLFSSGSVMVHGNIDVIDSNSSYLYSVRYPDSVNMSKMLFFNFMPNLTVSFSRSCFGVVLVPDFPSRNDYAYWLKMLAAGDRVQVSSCNTGVISSAYRLTSSGLSSSSAWVNLWRWFLVSSRFYGPFFALLALPVYVTLQCVKKVSPACFSLLSSII